MISNLKPYPAMKDSGVEWLGDVPEHWEVLPNRAMFDEVKDRGYPDEQMLSVTIKKGVIRQSALLETTSKKDSSNLDKSNYKVVQPGDIAYNKMRAWQGAIGVSNYRGIISPAYVVQRPHNCSNPNYFHQLFRIPSFAKEAERWSYGIASDMWSLRPEHFKTIHSCFPPLSEQVAIVHYLDYVEQRVWRFVRAKQKLVELLKEQKQAIITRAITRGLDPNVPLKDSGIKWLGEVPEHWDVRRTKILFNERSEKGYPNEPLLAATQTKGVVRKEQYESRTVLALKDLHLLKLVCVGDFVISLRSFQGGIEYAHEQGIISPAYTILVVKNTENHRYLAHLFKSMPYIENLRFFVTGIRQGQNIDYEKLSRSRLPIPPLLEQTAIVEYLDRTTADIDTTIARARREIELLQEYRTRLIADVVTGKVDVRGVANSLPDEFGDSEPIGERNALSDIGEETERMERLEG